MPDNTENLAARVSALETVLVDVLAHAAKRNPALRSTITDRLDAIRDELAEIENGAEAEAVEFIREEFMRST